MNDLMSKTTSLESSEDIQDTLEWKIESIKEKDLPVESTLTDYISLAVDNLQAQLLQLKAVKEEIKIRENDLKTQEKKIKEEGALFFKEHLGVDKLEGNIVSSVTVTKAREEKVELIEKEGKDVLIELGSCIFHFPPNTRAVTQLNINIL